MFKTIVRPVIDKLLGAARHAANQEPDHDITLIAVGRHQPRGHRKDGNGQASGLLKAHVPSPDGS